MVYVLDIDGRPLMPTKRCRKVKMLLKQKKAKVVSRTPFTIQLAYEPQTHNTQPIALGLDAGSVDVGISASTEKEELFSAEFKIRADVPDLMSARRVARHTRRNRKTRYRVKRFDNRRRPKGWLTPTMEAKTRAHENAIAKVCSILPVTEIKIEVASFDIQKIKDPGIEGKDYQEGEQLGYENVKAYVKARDFFTCRCCGSRDHLEVHHIVHRKDGGSNRPDNLITLCSSCHKTWHEGKSKDVVRLNAKAGFKAMTEMNTMRWILIKRLKAVYTNVSVTYGYITKNTRNRLGLEKSHATDAWCIAGNLNAERIDTTYSITCVRSHNRKIYKDNTKKGGKRQRHQAPHVVMGIRLFDKVLYNNEEMTVTARKSRGVYSLKPLEGRTLSDVPRKRFELLEHSSGGVWTKRQTLPK